MKKFIFVVLIVAMLAGCSGVIMNAEYSQLLDKTAALSGETATRAVAGTLSEADKTAALVKQAETWQKFVNARDGVK